MKTYTIPFCNFDRLKKSIEKMNRKLKFPITVVVIGETVETRKNAIGCVYEERCYQIELQGEAASLSSAEGVWQMVASLKPVNNDKDAEIFVHEIPGQSCPIKYRKADLKLCDHCKTRRKRNSVYVMLSPTGEYFQIGRSCIREFIGGIDPESFLRKSDALLNVDRVCNEASKSKWKLTSEFQPSAVDIDEFVTVVSVVIRRQGWVPRTKSTNEVKATTDIAWNLCMYSEPTPELQEMAVENLWIASEDDNKLAKDALSWARVLSNEVPNSYLYNLGVACRQESVTTRNAGYVASVIEAYKKSIVPVNVVTPVALKHLGEIDKRQTFENLQILSTREFNSDYGTTTLIKFKDPEGNLLEWWASAGTDIKWIEEGKVVSIKATVKEHKTFQNKPYTVLLRAKQCV